MSTTAENKIIELTDVVEEGHPDRPNLPPQGATPNTSEASGNVLSDLDLEKEIDQIFADLGAPSSTDAGLERPEKSSDNPLDDLFWTPDATTKKQHPDEFLTEQKQQPDKADGESFDQEPSKGTSLSFETEQTVEQSGEQAVDVLEPDVSLLEALPAAIPMEADRIAPLLERLTAMEENVARLDTLEQLFFERLEIRLEAFAQEQAVKQQEQMTSMRQELWAELEQHFEQTLRSAIEEANAKNLEALSQHHTATQTEEMASLVDSRIQELQSQEEISRQKISDTVSVQLDQLRADLLQELEEAIPTAAARIIREEIQALSQEDS